MSKRNQKKIENELKDLINERGNSNKCGECSAGFPTWASTNLGIFLCGRCASLHRNLGSDISVVKSLTLDKWESSDLDNLAAIGNKKAKQFWNPKGVPFPYDDDDKDELYLYLRHKYINGKFRYSPPVQDDYNLNGHSSRNRSRSGSRSRSSTVGSRSGSSRSGLPKLSRRDIPEIERLKYRKLEPQLKDQGFRNVDDNYEALSLAKGDIRLAAEILRNSPQDDPNEVKPPLPRRPGTSTNSSSNNVSQPVASSGDWWNGNGASAGSASSTTTAAAAVGATSGLIEPPQQYLDPATGIIYVDPVQQQQYLQQQEQLQQQQLLQQQQFSQQPTGLFSAQQQLSQPTGVFVQPQRTGIDKNQLLSLYNQPTLDQQQAQLQQQQLQQQQLQQAQLQQQFTQQQQQPFLQNQFTQQQQNPYYQQNQFGFQ